MTKGAVWMVGALIAASACGGDRMNASEMAVVRELQTINTAQIQYMSRFDRFAKSLEELGWPADKDGYLFTMHATPSGYTVHANPKVFKITGWRTFYTDQTAQIHQNWSEEPASAASPEFK